MSRERAVAKETWAGKPWPLEGKLAGTINGVGGGVGEYFSGG